MAKQTKKRTTAKKSAKRMVRKPSRNPQDPVGTATELVHRYWRTPRFKKDRAWLEEHLGQQKLFQYNPATVKVGKIKGGYAVMIGQQIVGKASTKADALRRAKAIKATGQKMAARKKNPVSAKKVIECKKILAADKREKGSDTQPTYSYWRNPSRLHIVSITPGNFGVFLGKFLLKKGFKTKTSAELHLRSILRRRKNPSGKIAEKVAKEFLQTFDVDRDGRLDQEDLAILDHFNDPALVMNDTGRKVGELKAKTKDGRIVVEWSDGKTTVEKKSGLQRINGFRSWRLRRKAARQYKRALKYSEKATRAQSRQARAERAVERQAKKERRLADLREKRRSKKNPVQKDLAQFRLQLRKIQTSTTVTKGDIRTAVKYGKAAGLKVAETKKLIRKAYGKRPAKLKKNPGFISAIAEIAMGTAAALEVKRQLTPKKRTTAKKRAKAPVRNCSQRPAKKRPVNNSPATERNYEEFQGRPSEKTVPVDMPAGTPKNVWCLGRLWELRVKGYGNLDLSRSRFYLVSDPQNRRLYIAGPRIVAPQNQLGANQRIPLGEITHVVYETEKRHLGDEPGDPTPYIHKMGEEGGKRPILAVDRDGRGHIEGGSYSITSLGIKN